MIGGIVIGIKTLADRVLVNCVDENESRNDKCSIYVERNEQSARIKPGDLIWWQGGFAMWTPYEKKGKAGNKEGVDCDVRIPKIGFSFSVKPT